MVLSYPPNKTFLSPTKTAMPPKSNDLILGNEM